MSEPSLWDAVEPAAAAPAPAPKTIQERFIDFHARHPEVMAKLIELIREVRGRGKKCGIRTLWEKMRWSFEIERDAAADFKLNDHYHSRYARLILATHPEFDGFFETRRLVSE